MKVIFLHIPKTAGQSVHAALVDGFGNDSVCPARTNEQLMCMSITELNRYQVFSGHFDWSLLDCIRGPRYVFTVLREPIDRALSFYFYLRSQAEGLSKEELGRPEYVGLKAAIELSPNEYFMGGPPDLRAFLDNHYDNFYTYYFSGRHHKAREEFVGLIAQGTLSPGAVLQQAKDNLAHLDNVFSVDDLDSAFASIGAISTNEIVSRDRYFINANSRIPKLSRKSELAALGADDATLEKIEKYGELDNEIWKLYSGK